MKDRRKLLVLTGVIAQISLALVGCAAALGGNEVLFRASLALAVGLLGSVVAANVWFSTRDTRMTRRQLQQIRRRVQSLSSAAPPAELAQELSATDEAGTRKSEDLGNAVDLALGSLGMHWWGSSVGRRLPEPEMQARFSPDSAYSALLYIHETDPALCIELGAGLLSPSIAMRSVRTGMSPTYHVAMSERSARDVEAELQRLGLSAERHIVMSDDVWHASPVRRDDALLVISGLWPSDSPRTALMLDKGEFGAPTVLLVCPPMTHADDFARAWSQALPLFEWQAPSRPLAGIAVLVRSVK